MNIADDNRDLVQRSSVVVISVKPDDVEAVFKEISRDLNETHVVISFAAGRANFPTCRSILSRNLRKQGSSVLALIHGFTTS